jgi:hypothetical protein
MTKQQAIEKASAAVTEILSVLGVNQVVCVDDTYSDAPTLEEVIVAARTLDEGKLKQSLPEIGDNVPQDPEVISEKIRQLWPELEPSVKAERTTNILTNARLQDMGDEDDTADAMILSQVIPNNILKTLSPTQWEIQREQILGNESVQKTLFLFDQDLSNDDGDPEGGIKIISSILSQKNAENIICGLLTHTVTPDNQDAKWIELSARYNLKQESFLVISKQYLHEDPLWFAQTLKLIALSPDFAILKGKVKDIIKNANQTAGDLVDEISIYDLDHMVFRVTDREGSWEPDMMFRLYALHHRLESRRLAYEGDELEEICTGLRSVSHIPTDSRFKPPSSTWKLQNAELYENADYLNRNHLPLELGDIFKKIKGRKHYILLAQPCDLMLRINGKREPELDHVPMAEVILKNPKKKPYYSEELICFGDEVEADKMWYVNLKAIHMVRVSLLDLCIFNTDGKATIWIDEKPPERLRPAWKKRHGILQKDYKRLVGHILLVKSLNDHYSKYKAIKAQLENDLSTNGLFKCNLVNKKGYKGISYNLQRVSRLSNARAHGVLMAYNSVACRPAYDPTLN